MSEITPLNLAQTLARKGNEAQSTVRRALKTVREHLDMDVAYISDMSGERWELLAVDAGPGAPELGPVGLTLDKECTFCHNIAVGRIPEILPDTADSPAALALAARDALSIHAHISVPLRSPDTGEPFGMFCCYSTSPNHTLQERDQRVMEAFADVSAAELQRELLNKRATDQAIARVRRALEPNVIDIAYQPIIALGTGALYAAEALCRVGLVPYCTPDIWLAEAEMVGLRVDVELAALSAALSRAPFGSGCRLCLNTSPDTVLDPRFQSLFINVPIDEIILEITEQIAVDDYDKLSAALAPFREVGGRLAVDDVGGGYASLKHILQLRPDLIKADMSLTRNVDKDLARRALISAIVDFSKSSGTHLLAEGVETEDELKTLTKLGVDFAQGYFLGRQGPITALGVPTREDVLRACMPARSAQPLDTGRGEARATAVPRNILISESTG